MPTAELTFKELADVKLEINTFIDLEFDNIGELDKNNLKFILKKVVFLKYLIRQDAQFFLFQALSSDIIYLISSIKKGEVRYYYFNIRSIIEHSLRIINNIDSTDTITNANLIKKTQKLLDDSKAKINLDVVKNEYNTSCLYIHGNKSADLQLVKFYQNCVEQKGPIKDLTKKLNVLIKLFKELFELLIITQCSIVDAAYHRRKSILKFLIGNESYSIFEQFKKE
ncbi:hypothetical protein [Longirhabdus pacifica]|uniref:hypothetical protein n=1 Tax=Longirhabdus pacifica TaxID=2305227 RepID=UPI001008AA24|nr:hypothetical protein [Longirhabdus pacifica]